MLGMVLWLCLVRWLDSGSWILVAWIERELLAAERHASRSQSRATPSSDSVCNLMDPKKAILVLCLLLFYLLYAVFHALPKPRNGKLDSTEIEMHEL